MNDCAWCNPGVGNGICSDCMAKMFATSSEIAESGIHLASRLSPEQENTQDTDQAGEHPTTRS